MGTIIEDLYDHEGFGARRLPDGSLTGTWSKQTARFEAYVAACGCGWRGGNHPPNEDGYESAVDEWERSHARPLLAENVPAGVDTAVRDARQAIGRLARERPAAARRILDELGTWVAVSSRRLDPPTTGCASSSMRWPGETGTDPSACSQALVAPHDRVADRGVRYSSGRCYRSADGAAKIERRQLDGLGALAPFQHPDRRSACSCPSVNWRRPGWAGASLGTSASCHQDGGRLATKPRAAGASVPRAPSPPRPRRDDGSPRWRRTRPGGAWVDPRAGETPFADYARAWLRGHARISKRTREIYEAQLRLHVLPAIDPGVRALGDVALADLTPELVRQWYAALIAHHSPSVAAKAYTRLRQILTAAVNDDRIAKNPCRIDRGGVEHHPEQRFATMDELHQLAGVVPDRYRALVLTAGLAGLRAGELFALRWSDIDLGDAAITVRRKRLRLASGEVIEDGPKSQAGRRKWPSRHRWSPSSSATAPATAPKPRPRTTSSPQPRACPWSEATSAIECGCQRLAPPACPACVSMT